VGRRVKGGGYGNWCYGHYTHRQLLRLVQGLVQLALLRSFPKQDVAVGRALTSIVIKATLLRFGLLHGRHGP
jgi:hypothetical protein